MISQECLKRTLVYNPDTGIFTNRITRSNAANLKYGFHGNHGRSVCV